MKKIILAISVLSVLILSSCAQEGIKTEQTNNPNFYLTLLFEKDECKVYRFYDNGRYVYYTTCKGDVGYNTGGKTNQDIYNQTTNQ